MPPTNRVLEALAVEALRRVPELVAFVGRIANAQEAAAEAATFRALLAYAEAVGRPDDATNATSAAAVTAARAMAVHGAAKLARRLVIRAGAGAEADTAEHPENDAPARRRARRPAP